MPAFEQFVELTDGTRGRIESETRLKVGETATVITSFFHKVASSMLASYPKATGIIAKITHTTTSYSKIKNLSCEYVYKAVATKGNETEITHCESLEDAVEHLKNYGSDWKSGIVKSI